MKNLKFKDSAFLRIINNNSLNRMDSHVENKAIAINSLIKEIYTLSLDERVSYVDHYLRVVNICRDFGTTPIVQEFKEKFISFDDSHYGIFLCFLNNQKMIHEISSIVKQEFKNPEDLRYKSAQEMLDLLSRTSAEEKFFYHKVFTNAKGDFLYLLTKNNREEVVGMMDFSQDDLVKKEVMLEYVSPNKNGTAFSPFELTKVHKKNKIKNKMNEQFVQSE